MGTGMVLAPVLLKWLSLMLSLGEESGTLELLPKQIHWREEMFCCSAEFPGIFKGLLWEPLEQVIPRSGG